MPLAEIRVTNYRAFSDTGLLTLGPLTPIVGRNDAGKSGILHALQTFFEPPKKGGLDKTEIHGKDETKKAVIEIAFHPQSLQSQEILIDAKNKVDIANDCLVDSKGLLRIRLTLSTSSIEAFEVLIRDIDDEDLFPLALKKQDDLLELLEERGLPAKPAGKETNQQKRNTLRENALKNGVGFKEDWVDATTIASAIRNILPKFIFFTDSARYAIGETPVQNQFKSIVDRALSGHPNAQQIEQDIKATIQAEFDKLYERLARLTDTVTGIQADSRVSWKKAVDGIGLTWSDSSGVDLPYELRGAGVRRLFMVAYFQYEAAESMHDPSGPKFVFAVEEPEIHLHPGAQRDLEAALNELSELGHSVVFTTHSPVFASAAAISDLVLVQRPGASATASQFPAIDMASVARELGVEASDRLVGKNHVVLVEGQRDVEFYVTILTELFQSGHTALNPDDVLFLQCGGVPNLRFVVTTRCMDEAGLKWAVIVDSDKQASNMPIGTCTQQLVNTCPTTCSCLKVLCRTAIENYLDESVVKQVTGIDCIIPPFGKPTAQNGQPLSKADRKAIKNASASIAQAMGATGILRMSQEATGQSEWITVFRDIKSGFGL
jgi:putative ATP-dependent endonuclease of OLD family